MDQDPRSNLLQLIRSWNVVRHTKRQEFTVQLVQGVINQRAVHFREIAEGMGCEEIKMESLERRIQDYFQKARFDYVQLAIVSCCFCPHRRLPLSMDRTEWDFGRTRINILCILARVGKMGVPIYFELLDNNSGNSGHKDRIRVLERVFQAVDPQRIDMLLMDREFIGMHWLKWLKKQRIPFCVRVPGNHHITLRDGAVHTARELYEHHGEHYVDDLVVVDKVACGVSLSRGSDGELLYLIGTVPAGQLRDHYRKRWSIEVFFETIKKRGFDLESTRPKCLDKLRKLFALVNLVYARCFATGIEAGKAKSVRPKKHGYPQYSVFRRGLNLLRQFFRRNYRSHFMQALNLVQQRLALVKTVG